MSFPAFLFSWRAMYPSYRGRYITPADDTARKKFMTGKFKSQIPTTNMKGDTMKHLLITLIIFSLVCLAVGCAHLGIADRETMMERWRGKPVTENLLDDINGWANWYAQGEKQYPLEYAMEKPEEIKLEKVAPNKVGKGCLKQAETKLEILKELGVAAKMMHCVITRNDPWHPSGHAFVVATVGGKDYIMDNGAVQDVVWEYRDAIASTWGIEQIEEWYVRDYLAKYGYTITKKSIGKPIESWWQWLKNIKLKLSPVP